MVLDLTGARGDLEDPSRTADQAIAVGGLSREIEPATDPTDGASV